MKIPMPSSQVMLGAVAALLLVAIILIIAQTNQRPPTLGESMKEVVQEIKKK